MFFRTGFVGRQIPAASGFAPAMDIDLSQPSLDSRVTFTRSTTATDGTYLDAAGSSYNSFAVNQPRINQNGLLMEEVKTNFLLNSTAPATQTTGSLATGNYILWVIGTGSAAVSAGTATIGSTPTAVAGSPQVFNVSVAGTVTITVSGTLNRFQLENGNVPTSFIPTAGATVQRGADNATMNGSSFLVQQLGTLFVEAWIPFIGTTPTQLLAVGPAAPKTAITIAGGTSVAMFDSTGLNTVVGALISTPFRAAFAYSNGAQRSCMNGGSVVNASTSVSVNTLTLGIGCNGTVQQPDGYIKRVRYWNRMLSAAELQSATLIGTADQTLDMSFISSLDPRFAYTRNGQGSYYDTNGTIQYAPSNTPRFDYGEQGGAAPLGLLFEDARTNLYINSGDFSSTSSNASPNDVIKTANAGVAPDGTMSAALLMPSTGQGVHQSYRAFGGAASTTYCFSTYVKSAGMNQIQLNLSNTGFLANSLAFFNTDTGQVVSQGANCLAAGAIQCRNGWWRVWMAATSQAGIWVAAVVPSIGGVVNIQGDGVSGHYLWGGQVEAVVSVNAPQPTSYIPTAGASVLRGIDACTMPEGIWYNSAQGTMATEWIITNRNTTGAGVSPVAAEFDDGSNNNLIAVRLGNQVGALIAFNAGSSIGGPGSINQWQQGSVNKLAGNWSGTTGNICLNAGSVVNGAFSGALPATTRLVIGSGRSNALGGYMRRVRYWPRVLVNADMQAVTT